MPIITQCPACQRKLRVPDELLGKKVKCPGCGNTFTAADSAAAPERKLEPKPPSSSGIAGLDDLNLELDEEPPPPPPPRKEEKPKERMVRPEPAVEKPKERIVRSEPAPQPLRPKPASKAKPQSRTSDEDEDDGKEPCPYCGKRIKASSIRCKYCGEELDDEEEEIEDRPLRRGKRSKRGIRRDALPHRGGMILTLGIISVVSLALDVAISCCCLPVGFVINIAGVGTGIPAWIMGQRDLARMRTGEIDPSGKGSTQTGWICGMIGTILNGLFLVGGVALLIIYGAAMMSGTFMNPSGGNPGQGNPFGPQPGPGRKSSAEPDERKLWHYLPSREIQSTGGPRSAPKTARRG